ncbi:hypothetical protein F5148DRAFT_924793 [Russula earlei]|uniref:Uncharacterized protein n=1 Tax=Russula earlei TaxID=71964 RepID=A0ACC0TRJ5_9AGAM|nr:hypothetical protein F5148DRAFT_924793 [Russula earlei]
MLLTACLTLAAAHPLEDISCSTLKPESSESPLPTCHVTVQLVRSPWPTDSQLPMQDVIFALFDTLPSHTSSMTSSHLRDEDSIGEWHNYERPQTHAYHARIHELGDVMLRPLLRGFVSSEKVSYTLVPPLPSYHSAPSVLPISASSTPSIQAHPKSAPPCVYR